MLSVSISPVQWADRTSPDLPAVGRDLIWEQEAAGSNPAIPTKRKQLRWPPLPGGRISCLACPEDLVHNLGASCDHWAQFPAVHHLGCPGRRVPDQAGDLLDGDSTVTHQAHERST
jgi:hypothetical protein